MAGNYTIVQSQLPLVGGLGGHNLIVVKDPTGKVIKEFDGLATTDAGVVKPIGYLPTDKLQFFEFNKATYYSSTQAQNTVYSSANYADISSRIVAIEQCGAQINAGNFSYPFLGLGKNSNSVSTTLMGCIGAIESVMPNGAKVMPGVGDLLLSWDTIDSIRMNNNITSIFSSLADTGSMFDNSWSSMSFGDLNGNFMGSGGTVSGFCCFPAGTRVKTVDGIQIPIEKVPVDAVLEGIDGPNSVEGIITCELRPGDRVYSINRQVECTWEQLFLGKGGVWLAVNLEGYLAYRRVKREDHSEFGIEDGMFRQMVIGDEVYATGSFCKVESLTCRTVEHPETLYSFVLGGSRTFLANDYGVESRVSSDCFDIGSFVKNGVR